MLRKGGSKKPLVSEEAGARARGRATRAAQSRDERPEAGVATGRGGRAGADKTQVYCICRKSHENGFMIACDECDEWFHGKCVNISAAQGRRMEKYVCPFCSERRRKRAGGAPRQPQRSLINDDDQDYEDDGEGDDEPLFSDDDSDEWNEDEAYAKAPWYDPEMDEVNYDEWEAAMAAKRREGSDGGGDEAGEGSSEGQHAGESEVMFEHHSAEDEAATEDHEYRPRTRRSSNGSLGKDGNGVKRKRIYDDAEDEEGEGQEEEEESMPPSEAGAHHYRGCDEATRAVRERVVTSLAEALSMPHPATAENEKTSVDAATALRLAESIEMEMWIMFEKQTNSAYKAKFRTLLFNLKDERNQGLRDSVLSGEMGPVELCKKTSKELAPVELAEWRKQRAEKYFNENVMITEEPGPILKKTHKGEEVLNGPASPTSHTDSASTTTSSPSLFSSAPASISSSSSSSSSATGDSLQARKRVRLSPPRPTREENGKEHYEKAEEGNGEEEESGMKYDEDDDEDDEPTIDINVDVSANLDEDDIFARPPMLISSGGAKPSLSSATALTRTPKPRVHESSATFPSSPSSSAAALPSAASAPSSSLSVTSPSRPTLKPESPGNLVWRGSLAKANVEKCDVVAYHLAGQHDTSLQQLLPEELQVRGRVDLSKLAKYIKGLSTSRHRTHSLLVLEPADDASSVAYIAMLHYFGTKSRAGVVVNLVPGAIKEMYVVPLTSDDEHFRGLLRLDEDKLLVVLVTDKDFKH